MVDEEIIKEFIDGNYIESFEYITKHIEDSLKRLDPLTCKYLMEEQK